jgi:CelD/BcsL family acetyltransferase involved in cellulose biosynthesis
VLESRFIDPVGEPDWLALVDGSPSGEIFHHPRWLELLREQYGYEFRACCVENGNGIEAGIPIARVESRLTGKRLVSLPFSDVCSPALATGASAGALDALVAALSEEAGRTGLALTVHGSLPDAEGAFVRTPFVRHVLPLAEDPAEVERGFSKSRIRGVKKARREDLVGVRRTDRAALDDFYSLHLRTRRKLGVPTQPRRFIRRFEELFDAGLGFVWLVLEGERPIAAAVFLTHNGTVTYKYGASDERALRKRPNNLLMSEAIRWACEAGFQSFDFGRTEIENEGLRAFKSGWGAHEIELPYTYFSEDEPKPESALRDRLMGATIRRSPTFVGRRVGEALYRHVA